MKLKTDQWLSRDDTRGQSCKVSLISILHTWYLTADMIIMQRKLRAGFKPVVELLDTSLQLPACLTCRSAAPQHKGKKKSKSTHDAAAACKKGAMVTQKQTDTLAALALWFCDCVNAPLWGFAAAANKVQAARVCDAQKKIIIIGLYDHQHASCSPWLQKSKKKKKKSNEWDLFEME